MPAIKVNGEVRVLDIEEDTPLLWVLRDTLGLVGTKFGCGVSACGACTVHVNGEPVRSCSTTIGDVAGKEIATIESLATDKLHPVQQAWIDHEVPQCGYCQSGMIMATTALLAENPDPTDADIDAAITNICRCGTYKRIRDAIHDGAGNNAENTLAYEA